MREASVSHDDYSAISSLFSGEFFSYIGCLKTAMNTLLMKEDEDTYFVLIDLICRAVRLRKYVSVQLIVSISPIMHRMGILNTLNLFQRRNVYCDAIDSRKTSVGRMGALSHNGNINCRKSQNNVTT